MSGPGDGQIGTFPIRGKSPGSPGTRGVPDPTPKYRDHVTNSDQSENVYEFDDEQIVSLIRPISQSARALLINKIFNCSTPFNRTKSDFGQF